MRRADWLGFAILFLCAGCSGKGGGDVVGPSTTPPGGGAGGSGGSSLSLGGAGGSSGAAGSAACITQSAKAELQKQPVDIIVVADTSKSMGAVTNAIELNINTKLTNTLQSAKLDFRVVLLASYGSGSAICVVAPLGGGTCNPIPSTPELSPELLHYDYSLGSKLFLNAILNSFTAPDQHGLAPNGWSAFLRPAAKKVFLAFTDGESGPVMSSAAFDEQLLALTPSLFGTKEDRNYVFHTFAGVAPQGDASQPWLPTDPIAPSGCGHPKAQPLQELSVLSGGLRFPLCLTDKYDSVFEAVAKDVIDKAVLSCELPFPVPSGGETLDPNTIQVEYQAGSGSSQTLNQVKSEADCTSSSFYVEQNSVHLCPDACASVQSDLGAALQVEFGCDVGFVK